jgi:hypothetical protein
MLKFVPSALPMTLYVVGYSQGESHGAGKNSIYESWIRNEDDVSPAMMMKMGVLR